MPICEICKKHEGHAISFKINVPLADSNPEEKGWSNAETIFVCDECGKNGVAVRDHLRVLIQKIRVTHGIMEPIGVGVINEKHYKRGKRHGQELR